MLVRAQRVAEDVSPAARVSLSSDGSRVLVLATGVEVFDAAGGARREVVLGGRKDVVHCIDATPEHVAVGRGKSVHLLDVAVGGLPRVIETHRRFLFEDVVLSGGVVWTSTGWDGHVRGWDAQTAAPTADLSVFELARQPERLIQGFVPEAARGRLTCLVRTRPSGSPPTYALHRISLATGATEWTLDVSAQAHGMTRWFTDSSGTLRAWGEGSMHRLAEDGVVVTEVLTAPSDEGPCFDWGGRAVVAVPPEDRADARAVWCPLSTVAVRVLRRTFYRGETLHTELVVETAAGRARIAGALSADPIGAREVGSRVEVFVRHPADPKGKRTAVSRFDFEPTPISA